MSTEMEVVRYLKKHGLRNLVETFSIRVKEYDDLIVLNYDQIQSSKSSSIVKECRSLILDYNWNVVSRAFDRFFNFGEENTSFDPSSSEVFEKIDGSLIKIYNYKNQWYISTRRFAYAEGKVGESELTYKEMVLKALHLKDDVSFQDFCDRHMNKDNTYIFEVTGPENRIVTQYNDYGLWFLAVRNNQTGIYDKTFSIKNVKYPRCYKFSTVGECIEAAKALKDLQEGYVAYNKHGEPTCKVKSPAYVAIHHLQGNDVSDRSISRLVVMNEHEEYLKYFPENAEKFKPFITGLQGFLTEAKQVYDKIKHLTSQKDFAFEVKDYPWSTFAFKARKCDKDIMDVFYDSQESIKVKFLMDIVTQNHT